MVGSKPSSYILHANRNIHLCEQVIGVASLSKEPKLLLKALTYAQQAIENAVMGASLLLDGEPHDLPVVLKMLHEEVPSAAKVQALHDRIMNVLLMYKNASMIVRKGEQLLLANDEFSDVVALNPTEVNSMLSLVKQFVYETGKLVVLDVVNE